ncbi:M14 family zinc carboxypeptidase, partial [candidate division KSB1 bacterium]
MRKKVPNGDYKLHHKDPRIMVQVEPGQVGDYINLGSEGIDNDGDGRINEDGPGGYDANRDWPSEWQPNYVQGGAYNYPLHLPESKAVADFIKSHPNIAGVQSYHNSGGMILRGPGIKDKGDFPSSDIRVYDYLGEEGEKMLPFYRYIVIWKDLYTVWGGFLDWTFKMEGIFTFSNEIFSSSQYYNKTVDRRSRDRSESEMERLKFNDYLEFGDMFVDWKPYNHPVYGEIEIGGWKKLSRRVNPLFLLEETCHRNTAFTLFHAEQMPLLKLEKVETEKIDKDVYKINVSIRNERIIPSVAAHAANKNLHRGDIAKIEGNNIEILLAGIVQNKWTGEIDAIDKRPQRILLKNGISGNSTKIIQWIVKGRGKVNISFDSLKGGKLFKSFELK